MTVAMTIAIMATMMPTMVNMRHPLHALAG